MGSITQNFKRAPLPPDSVEVSKGYEGLERELIFSCVASYRFFSSIKDVICPWDALKRSHRSDFSIERYNILFSYITAYYQRFSHLSLTRDISIPATVLAAYVIDAANRSGLAADIATTITDEIAEEAVFTASLTYESARALVESDGFKTWLEARILSQTTGRIAAQRQLGYLTLDTLEAEVAKARHAVTPLRTDHFANAANFIRGTRKVQPCVPIPDFPKLTAAVGGGLFWGDTTLIAAISGGGKTICATQLAQGFAYMGYNTVLFTTERRPDELFVRSVSNKLNVELTQLTNSVPGNVEIEVEVAYIPDWVWANAGMSKALLEMEQVYNEHLLFVDWSQGQGNSIPANFEMTMNQITQTGWEPAIVLFDWVGGGINVKDKDFLRLYYKEAIDTLINHGKRTNRIMITFAQLDKMKATGSCSWVDMSMLAECKSMPDLTTNFIGITAKRDKDPREGVAAIQRMQNFCVGKSTRGQGGKIPVEACFKFQRFSESKGTSFAGGS